MGELVLERKCFSIFVNDKEFILPKEGIIFKNGYAVVKVQYYFLVEKREAMMEMMGIVDENYQLCHPLVPCFKIPKIDIFSNGLFLVVFNEEEKNKVYLCKLTHDGLVADLDLFAYDYELVSEERVILKSLLDDGRSIFALFDVPSKTVLTPYFNSIGKFKFNKEYQSLIADAYAYFYLEELKRVCYIHCLIDLNGNVVSDYQNSFNQEYYDKNLSLSQVLEMATNDNQSRKV